MDCGEDWKTVTIAHVLSQTIGIASWFLDIDVEDIRQYPTGDFLRLVLRAPLVYRPGEKMVYSDSNYYLASRIVAAVSGKKLQDFCLKICFNPLHFQGAGWATARQAMRWANGIVYPDRGDAALWCALFKRGGIWEGRAVDFRGLDCQGHCKPGRPGTRFKLWLQLWRLGEKPALITARECMVRLFI